jgi:uncharacterized protein (DUF1786 family)
MEILAVDIGTGTQDILVCNSELDLENSFKLVVPSPTMVFHREIRHATELQRPVLLTGVLMGGGPLTWAAEAHLDAGLRLYATPSAARTFNDDLELVQREMGVIVVSVDEAESLPDEVMRLDLKDFDFERIAASLAQLGYSLTPDLIAVAVFDHGDAPPGYSDRQFRFDYLERRIQQTAHHDSPARSCPHRSPDRHSSHGHGYGSGRHPRRLARPRRGGTRASLDRQHWQFPCVGVQTWSFVNRRCIRAPYG